MSFCLSLLIDLACLYSSTDYISTRAVVEINKILRPNFNWFPQKLRSSLTICQNPISPSVRGEDTHRRALYVLTYGLDRYSKI